MEDIDLSQEFTNPDVNFMILLKEVEQEIRLMQQDLLNIKSPIIMGYAQKQYLYYKLLFFRLLAKDLELLKLYETNNPEEESDDGFSPM